MIGLLTLFFTSFVVAFSGAMMPGPLMTATISESAIRGPWVGPKMIAGHAVLEILLLITLFFGLEPIFKNEWFFVIVSLAGGGIMIWMATGMFRSLPELEIKTESSNSKRNNLYLTGILMSLANPYWIIWWATIGLGYVMISKAHGITGVIFFFIGHILEIWYGTLPFRLQLARGGSFSATAPIKSLSGFVPFSFLVLQPGL